MLSKNYRCEIQISGNRMIKFPGMDKSGRIFEGRIWLKKGCFVNDNDVIKHSPHQKGFQVEVVDLTKICI
jgi:hypothetical protein